MTGGNVRQLIDFIKANARMPTPTELKQLGYYGALTAAKGTKEFNEQVAFLERMADFIQEHGRIPTPDEIPPDPF